MLDFEKKGERIVSVYDRKNHTVSTGKIENDLIPGFRFFPRWGNAGYLVDELTPDLIYEVFPDLLKRSE